MRNNLPENTSNTQATEWNNVLLAAQAMIVLRVSTNHNVSHKRIVQKIISRMIDRCHQRENQARTIQGREALASSIVLGTLWFVLSVLPTQQKELDQI